MKKVISVVGARPNFMKIAPIHRAFRKFEDRILHGVCHTGQHYDTNMSQIFFTEFGLPEPEWSLGVGGGSHAEQTARIMIGFEEVCIREKPDLVLVVGDVNSTLACSLVAKKQHIPLAHVEAGLRSFDRSMPEEINRMVTDALSDLLFVTEPSGIKNLRKEGISDTSVFFCGNVMIDCLVNLTPRILESNISETLRLNGMEFILVTFHRPSNVDDPSLLTEVIQFLNRLAAKRKVIFPIHPRTRKNLEILASKVAPSVDILMTDPLGYLDFQSLVRQASMIVTDSGGIQEETTFLGIPCITVRNSTERPVTVDIGTNYLVGTDLQLAWQTAEEILSGNMKKGRVPELWDGKAAERIAEVIDKMLYLPSEWI
jgi:UDP-N-acetylglucosamine 2-epimerase (non-hydrolysing)